MRINQITGNKFTEARDFQSNFTPIQALVGEYAYFISFGIIAMDQDAKDQNSQKIILDLINRLQKDSKIFQPHEKTKLENNKNKILHYINSILEYIIPIMKTHLKPEAWDKRKIQINAIINKYNAVNQN